MSICASCANLSSLFGDNPMQVVDNRTVSFKFVNFDVRWSSYLLNICCHVGVLALSKKAFDEKGEEWMRDNVVATGPYQVEQWTRDDRIVLSRVENHWRKTGQVKNVNIIAIPEEATRVAMLRTGEVDAANISQKSNLPLLRDGFLALTTGQAIQEGVFFAGNLWEEVDARTGQPLERLTCARAVPWIGCPGQAADKGKVQDDMEEARLVRQALARSVDRDLLNETILGGQGWPVYVEYVDINDPHWQSKWEYPYDPQEAERLLDQAGYPRGANGMRFSEPIPLFVGPELGGGQGIAGEIGDAIAGFWERIGVPTQVLKYNYAVFRPGLVGRSTTIPFLTACDDGITPQPWDWPKGLVMSSLTRGGFSCGFESDFITKNYQAAAKEPDINKRIEYTNAFVDYIYHWALAPGYIVVPNKLTVNPKSIAEWKMRPSYVAAWSALENIVPAQR